MIKMRNSHNIVQANARNIAEAYLKKISNTKYYMQGNEKGKKNSTGEKLDKVMLIDLVWCDSIHVKKSIEKLFVSSQGWSILSAHNINDLQQVCSNFPQETKHYRKKKQKGGDDGVVAVVICFFASLPWKNTHVLPLLKASKNDDVKNPFALTTAILLWTKHHRKLARLRDRLEKGTHVLSAELFAPILLSSQLTRFAREAQWLYLTTAGILITFLSCFAVLCIARGKKSLWKKQYIIVSICRYVLLCTSYIPDFLTWEKTHIPPVSVYFLCSVSLFLSKPI